MAIRPEIQAIIDAAKNETQNIRPEIQQVIDTGQIEPPPGAVKSLIGKAKRLGTQFQRGSEKQTQDLTQLLAPEHVPETRVDIEEPVGFGETVARGAGEFLTPSPMVANVPGLAFTINQTASVLSKAAKASKVVTGTLDEVSKAVLEPIAKATKKTIGFVGETLSAVPREFIERAITKEIEGKSIFKGKFNPDIFRKLGERLQKAVNHIDDFAGKAVGEEKLAIKGNDSVIQTSGLINKANSLLEGQTFDEITALNKKDISSIKEIMGLLAPTKKKVIEEAVGLVDQFGNPITRKITEAGKPVKMSRLLAIRSRIDDLVKFSPDPVNTVTDEGGVILKDLRKSITDMLHKNSDELRRVDAKFSKVQNIKTKVIRRIKEENVARNIKSLTTREDTFFKNAFQQIDELAPSEFKFYDNLQDAIARQAFENLFPGRGGGSGGAQGAANIFRTIGVVTNPLLAPAFSPKVQGLAIQGAGAAGRGVGAAGRAIPQAIQKTGITPTAAGAPLLKRLLRTKEAN